MRFSRLKKYGWLAAGWAVWLTAAAPVYGYSWADDSGLKTTAAGTGHAALKLFEGKTLPEMIGLVIEIILGLIGVLLFGLLIYAGYLWMTAMGNEQTVSKARDIMKNSVIGLIIISLAYIITAYLVNTVKP